MPWIVKLTRPVPAIKDDYRSDFFPRRFHYKKDAIELKKEVESKGGQAVVEKQNRIK